MSNNSITIIFDNIKYKDNEELYKKHINKKFKYCNFYYTEYEDKVIRFVRKIKIVGAPLRRILYWNKSLMYAIKIFFLSKDRNILCINPIVGYFLSLLNLRNKKNIILMGFLFEPKKSKLYYKARHMFIHYCIKKISKIIVYSSNEVDYYKKLFNIKDKFKFIKYGIDYPTMEKYKKELPEKYIASGGGSNRDYNTLMMAYKDQKLPLCIATLPEFVSDELLNNNIKVLNDVTVETFGSFLEKSKFMVVPLKKNNVSAGHMVILQGLKLNKVMIVTDIDAVRDYVNENEVIFVKANDYKDLNEKIKFVNNNFELISRKFSNNNKVYVENFTFLKLFERSIDYASEVFDKT